MRSDQPAAQIARIIDTAQRLRSARAACRQFLSLWALQKANVASVHEEKIADHHNHDWSLLYRGSVLDD